jgi:hypothetical protein
LLEAGFKVDGFLALGASFFLSPQHRLRNRVMSRSNNPEGQDSHEDMGNCRRVLIVLFCVSYLVRHPSTVDQTFAKLFPHNAAETS